MRQKVPDNPKPSIRQGPEQSPWNGRPTGSAALKANGLAAESDRLRTAWTQYGSELLDRYLVTGVEDPRINLQSIISRAFLIDAIWPDEFTGLVQEEFRFSICMNFILHILKNRSLPEGRKSILDALINDRQAYGDVVIPSCFRRCFELISGEKRDIPDYISQALTRSVSGDSSYMPDGALSTFEQIWGRELSFHDEAKSISVLEPACGSANDYRYLHSFGVSKFLNYTGFDICAKNIANARRRFPTVAFEVGNVLDIPVDDKSYDYLFVHDLFEHLSPAAIDIALAEICRVTRKEVCLSFFNMADIDEHVVEPAGLYYWNTLSVKKVSQVLMNSACDIDVIHIDTFLRDNYDCDDYHNKEAYTLMVSFDAG